MCRDDNSKRVISAALLGTRYHGDNGAKIGRDGVKNDA